MTTVCAHAIKGELVADVCRRRAVRTMALRVCAATSTTLPSTSRRCRRPGVQRSARMQASQVRWCSALPSPGFCTPCALVTPACSRHVTAEVGVFALACHAGRAARPGHHGARWDRVYEVSGSRLLLTHTCKAAALQASTADDGCMPCPARALREATRISAGGAHPPPHRA